MSNEATVESAKECAGQSKLFDLSNGKWDPLEIVGVCGAVLVGALACWGLVSRMLGWLKSIALWALILFGGNMLLKKLTGNGFLDWIPDSAKQWLKDHWGIDLTNKHADGTSYADKETVVGAAKHVVGRVVRNEGMKYTIKGGVVLSKGLEKAGNILFVKADQAVAKVTTEADKLAAKTGKVVQEAEKQGMYKLVKGSKKIDGMVVERGVCLLDEAEKAGQATAKHADADKVMKVGQRAQSVGNAMKKKISDLSIDGLQSVVKNQKSFLAKNRSWWSYITGFGKSEAVKRAESSLKSAEGALKQIQTAEKQAATLAKAGKKAAGAAKTAKYVGKPVAKIGSKVGKYIPFVGWGVGIWCAGQALLRKDKSGKTSWDWELAGCELASGALGGCTALTFGQSAWATAGIEGYMAVRRKQKYGEYI